MTDREYLWQLLGRLRSIRDSGGLRTYDSLVHEIATLAQETAEQLSAKKSTDLGPRGMPILKRKGSS